MNENWIWLMAVGSIVLVKIMGDYLNNNNAFTWQGYLFASIIVIIIWVLGWSVYHIPDKKREDI